MAFFIKKVFKLIFVISLKVELELLSLEEKNIKLIYS